MYVIKMLFNISLVTLLLDLLLIYKYSDKFIELKPVLQNVDYTVVTNTATSILTNIYSISNEFYSNILINVLIRVIFLRLAKEFLRNIYYSRILLVLRVFLLWDELILIINSFLTKISPK